MPNTFLNVAIFLNATLVLSSAVFGLINIRITPIPCLCIDLVCNQHLKYNFGSVLQIKLKGGWEMIKMQDHQYCIQLRACNNKLIWWLMMRQN